MNSLTIGVLSRLSIVALAVSAALNVGLVLKMNAVEEKAKPGLHVGDSVPTIRPRGASSAADRDRGAGVPTLVYHFSATCGWCERNWANLSALAKQTEGRLRVVAVSIAPLPAGFVSTRGLNFEVVDNLPSSSVLAYKLAATPQSIVVGADGRVRESWFGAYSGSFAKQVESFFKVRLPGLVGPRQAATR